ncbi:hypothetical protein GYMLUDRAFT_71889 [Collybiopsis luxurians FD-317 M1]|uniref:Peptidase S9 prolyl oligopeptidase catalytic domain-containing protein n=1 Tax=Collybiopsis luxurians FD-317 M1 TaxID=944289 RepID=A0A0D0C6J4_9AGAR|nr:hypothetical protein GYMLUDRAFT_71889 [Collybiopsis luxurians FD-317 M1]
MLFSNSQWSLKLSHSWDILGPFPIHAREQHFMEPSFPIDVGQPIDFNATYPSSYADGGRVSWSKTQARQDGVLEVVFPHSVRWRALRDTEGWAALQHHALLKTSLTIYPSSHSPPPHLRIQLTGASYFTIMPQAQSESFKETPRWYAGNIYDMERALPRVIELPEPPLLDKPTTYDIFVSGDYEIRLFGDPRIQHGLDTPAQRIKLEVEFDKINQVVWEPSQDVVPDWVSGWAFGDSVGVGLRSRDGWWSVQDVKLTDPELDKHMSLSLPSTEFRLAPTQARILPLRLLQHKDFPKHLRSIDMELTLKQSTPGGYLRPDAEHSKDSPVLQVSLSVTHLAMWNTMDLQTNPVIRGSYFFGVEDTMPTNFLVIPPRLPGNGRAPILALHGAGVDIFALSASFWTQALPRQNQSWVVIPSGRTSWGLDWHGPSAQDAWRTLDAVTDILQTSESTEWGRGKWAVPTAPGGKPRAILIGHSNGGQGAWYIAERFPDRVLGLIPASAYIKSQSYVPWTMSHSAHFADPFLEAILRTSLTPDDNDLFLGNLHGKDVLAVHGGDDENVPAWHSRELVAASQNLQTAEWNTSRIEYYEVPGQQHWFPSVLNNARVQTFIDQLLQADSSRMHGKDGIQFEKFMLTVAIPSEASSLHGWHVEKLFVPGRLGRLSVSVINDLSTRVIVETTNIHEFSVDPKTFGVFKRDVQVWIDGKEMHLDKRVLEGDDPIYFSAMEPRMWKLSSDQNKLQLSGRIQTILSSPYSVNTSEGKPAPLVFVVPDAIDSSSIRVASHAMSIALRLTHDLHLYHRIDSEIVLDSEVDIALSKSGTASSLGRSNIVVVGNEAAFALQNLNLKEDQVLFSKKNAFFNLDDFLAKIRVHSNQEFNPGRPEIQSGQGILFLHPHPTNSRAKMLLLQSTDSKGSGLERAARLFPIRTGVPVPDWIIVGGDGGKGEGNVIATGLWNSEWDWNAVMSWSSLN